MNTHKRDSLATQGYQILAIKTAEQIADACAQFMYKGYQISMSTAGYASGACSNEVAVFDGKDIYRYLGHSVEECILWVDSQ